MTGGLNILSAGMVTAVGLDCASSCAAMRGRLDGFQDTRFVGSGGEWQLGAPVPLPRNWIGETRLARLAAGAIVDALKSHEAAAGNLTMILCLAEPDRPGATVRDFERFAERVKDYADLPPATRTLVAAHGRPSGFVALDRAREVLKDGKADYAMIVGVDSLLTGPSIAHYMSQDRLLTPDNANGFLPGEAAAALLCAAGSPWHFAMAGLGMGREKAFIYNKDDLPLRGDGMTAAYKKAMDAAGIALAGIEYRISDLIGESYFFKQAALAALHLVRGRSEYQELWSPGESLGNIGAAVVPLMIGMALTAFEKGYHPGSPVLIEASGDDGACGAAVFRTAEAA